MAGLNAARRVSGDNALALARPAAYLGVRTDYLLTPALRKPHRTFTPRAEYRLSLRADNADQRLTGLGEQLGIVGAERAAAFQAKMAALVEARKLTRNLTVTPNEATGYGITVRQDGVRRSAFDLLSLKGVEWPMVQAIWPQSRGL